MRLILLLLAAVAITGCDTQKAQQQQGAEAEASPEGVPTQGVDRRNAGKPFPDADLTDPDNDPGQLAELKGQPVLVNLWATWCAPCVKELPTLDALSRSPKGPRVVVLSQDMAPRASVEAFLDTHKVGDAESWHDPKMAFSGAVGATVMPTTIYYDAAGREVWRYVGDLDWTGEEAARLLREGGAEG